MILRPLGLAARLPVPTSTLRRAAPVIALGLIALAPGVASAAKVAVASATASSTYPADDGGSYEAAKVFDGKASTSWVEGDNGSGLGAWIQLDLGGAKDVDSIKVWGGMWYSPEFWGRANRPKSLELEFSDGSKHVCAMTDEQSGQLCVFGKKNTSSIKVRMEQIYNGTTWLDTGISEIQVFDGAASGAKTKGIKASSTLAADGDGNYDVANVSDGISDTMWCEGSKDGDGVGETLEFSFDGSPTISSLSLINGVGGSMTAWFKANRATSATLTFADGSSQKIAVKNSMKLETVSFSPKATSSVKLKFDEVARGKEFNDLCISEAYFGP